MNIFCPCYSPLVSVWSLDDKRLIKQILECYQIYRVAIGESTGYANHPIVKHYSQYPKFVCIYGYGACLEYYQRFGKKHKYKKYFKNEYKKYINIKEEPVFLYAEYSKNDTRCIRTTNEKEVHELYKLKLYNKWIDDKSKGHPPKWTNRKEPEFYKHYSEVINMDKCCFCGKELKGLGNNPYPVASPDNTCCDLCNISIVIPARIKLIRGEKNENSN